jgi:cytochrome c-type biogenesis protein CcmH
LSESWLRLSAATAITISLAASIPIAASQEPAAPPAASHPAPAPGGVAESSEAVMKVTTRVLCSCGTCVNQTLHECTCGIAAQERDRVAQQIAGGKSPEDVIQAYVDEFGVQILATPDKKGFNLVGWLVPFVVSVVLVIILTYILRGWVRPEAAEPLASTTKSEDPVERRYRERLERELREFKG